MDTKKLFFEDLAKALDYWKNTGAKCLTQQDADLIWTDNAEIFQLVAEVLSKNEVAREEMEKVLEEIVRGFCISVLSAIDGGTSLAESTRITLRDHLGRELTQLREGFVAHLFSTGRLS